MILVDSRAGSGDLIPYLPKGECKLTTLEYGDCAFIGWGEKGPVEVGIEVKTLSDVLSCITNGRFSGHQLPGLLEEYQYVYLLVEGSYRCSREGVLEVPVGKGWEPAGHGQRVWMWRDLENWLNTIEICAGVRVKKCRRTSDSRYETGVAITALYRWFTEKEYESHRSHLSFDESGRPPLQRPGLVRRVAKELPGIGWDRSGIVAERFKTVADMVNAPTWEWEELNGIGKKTAGKVVNAIWGV